MRKRNLGLGEVSTSDSIPQRIFWPLLLRPFKTAKSAPVGTIPSTPSFTLNFTLTVKCQVKGQVILAQYLQKCFYLYLKSSARQKKTTI